MIAGRLWITLLVLNLCGILLVFRGPQVLAEAIDRLVGVVSVEGASAPPLVAAPRQAGGLYRENSLDAVSGTPVASSADRPSVAESGPAPDARPTPGDAMASMDGVALLRHQFSSEYGDSAWTAQVDQAIRTIASDNAAYTAISRESVECRERICRLALGYSDPALFDEFIGEVTMALLGDISASLYFDTPRTVAGNSRVEMYMVLE